MNQKLLLVCPASYSNKIAVIKAIRTLTGLGLKEAKDASERPAIQQTFDIIMPGSAAQTLLEEQFRILRNEGVHAGEPVQALIEDLRKLASQAVLQGEDELANEILQLVLAEKLRRAV